MIRARFYRGRIGTPSVNGWGLPGERRHRLNVSETNLDSAIGLDSVLPGANWERALTESGRARDAPSSLAGARDAMTVAQVLKEGKGQASKFAFDRLACWSAPCEARVQL
jgi:hypothetical protein